MVGVAPFVVMGVFSSTMQLRGRPGLEYSDAGLEEEEPRRGSGGGVCRRNGVKRQEGATVRGKPRCKQKRWKNGWKDLLQTPQKRIDTRGM